MELGTFATKVKALACLIRGLTLAVAIVPVTLAGTALAFDLNQHGLTGSWYNPAASGQGIEIEVYQDAIAPGIGYLQGSWATFAVGWETSFADNGQRWYTFGGPVRTGQGSVVLDIFENVGGKFDAPPATQGMPIGSMTLTVLDCTTAVMEYQNLRLDAWPDLDFPGWGPFSGTIPMVRLTPNVTCSEVGGSRPDADFAYSGHWFDPAIPGQGLFVELNPIAEMIFVVWYTYAPDGTLLEEAERGQRWYSGLGKFVPGTFTLPMPLYQSTGGVIGGSSRPEFATRTQVVGTATANFFDCHTAQLTFKLDAGSNAGASGTINLSRVGPAPQGCPP